MKKTLISLIFCAVLTISNSYAALNPYAYGLSSQLSEDKTTLTVKYSLNAPATSVVWKLVADGSVVKTIDLSDIGLTKGSYTTEIPTTDFPGGKSLTWKVEVKGESVATPTIQDTKFNFYLPYGLDCDVDPESDYLGNWYVIEANTHSRVGYVSSDTQRGLYAFDATLTGIKNKNGTYGFTGGMNVGALTTDKNSANALLNFYRVATSGGRVFIGRFRAGDEYHPIVEANPADLNAAFTSVYTSGEAVSIDAIGHGKDLKIVMLTKDFNVQEFDLGTAKSIASPSRTLSKTDVGIVRTDATIAYDNEGGVWFNQHRATATTTCATIAHLTANGVDYHNVKAELIHNNCSNSGIAVSPDGKQLAVVGAGTNTLTIYAISKDNTGKISLTNKHTISTEGSNHTALSYDYAGNLYVANRSAETITFYAMPYDGEVSTPCASKYAFEIPNPTNVVPRIAVHNLNVKIDGSCYNFNFDTNSAATDGKILFYDESDNKVGEIQISQVIKKGHNEVLIPMNEIPSKNDLCWGVELTGKDMEQYICRYNHTYFSQFKFYRPQDLITDNNPQSDCFGRTYITYPADGNKFNKQLGIFVLNHMFDSIAEGLKPTGMTIGNDERRIMHRIKIGPNGKIYVLDSDNNKIYEMEASASAPILHDNGSAKNIVADIDAISNVNEFCFKDDGTMYVINNPNYSQATDGGTGTLYEVVDGVATQFVTFADAKSNLLVSVDNSMEMDGRGGIWLAQGRYQWDKFPPLMHINSNGEIDFSVTKASSAELKALFPNVTQNLSTGGSMAYNAKEDLLAFGGGGYVTLFKVSYDANNKPTLTKWLKTSDLGGRIDGICFDYVGNMFVMSASSERFYAFAIPQVTNKVSVRAQNRKTVHRIIPLEDTKDNTTLLTDYKNEEEEVFVFRSLTAGMYNTLCLPFSLASFTGTPLENATVWQYNGATVENEATNKEIFLNFEEVTTIEAGKPYLVEPATDIAAPMEFKDVTISVTNGNDVAQGAVTMHGILHPTELQANNKSILFLVENNNLAWANETANMNGMRAYFKVNEPSLLSARTRAYIRREPTVATDMENITTSETEIKKVIYNGTLYIIRGDEVYTIQGNRIK